MSGAPARRSMPNPVVIFVGSSTEGSQYDLKIRTYLERGDAEVITWREIFQPGDYPIDALLAISSRVDGTLLIATPDDTLTYRGVERVVPRDNIVVELGFFVAKLGR